ncbi:MAG TPA: hypothetical protein VFT91_10300 [Dehalococcoidia bacterium]|nr:hypothetical protein [Dehalococcoidia bacterium]
MVKRYSNGQSVPRGLYWNRKTWELTDIPEEGGRLPAGDGTTYYHVPVLWAMALGPLVGLAFVIFLPLAVPIFLLYSLARAAIGRVSGRRGPQAPERTRLAR